MTTPPRRTGTIDRDAKGRTKAFQPTAEQRKLVENLAGIGLKNETIRRAIPWGRPGDIPISSGTFMKHFRNELERGQSVGEAKLARRMFDAAMEGNIAALIFLCKARLGWKESTVVEQVGKDGQPLAMPQALLYLPQKDAPPEEQSAAIECRTAREADRPAPAIGFDTPQAEVLPWRTDSGGDATPEQQAVVSLKPRDEHIDKRFHIDAGLKR